MLARYIMELNRRRFLAGLGASSAGSLFGFLGLDLARERAYAGTKMAALARSRMTTSICPYCAVGCGLIVMSQHAGGRPRVVNVEGDPDHPINEGTLCPKGASLYQLANNQRRLTKVLYRPPGGTRFVEKDWQWAAREIAARIKKTRDETFENKNSQGQVVNRTTAIASLGSAALDNEECWIYQKLLRSIGLVYIEHQARI